METGDLQVIRDNMNKPKISIVNTFDVIMSDNLLHLLFCKATFFAYNQANKLNSAYVLPVCAEQRNVEEMVRV